MRIKKIELIGFKSFADRTEIQLDRGVTCVVGPNGCGKSNIADAIRWVFGERSAKVLRGVRMDDVIFNGTDLRKPFGMAEVSITFENGDRTLPIEYDEVVFTRRLYRSGQSDYFLNRTSCRLRDLQNLLLDTGLGSNSYWLIEQGRVDAVINADPEERRYLIEEAAGISKYKVRKEEALRKLERTEQNLLRGRDILAEVQKNIQWAERQARRAERYQTQAEELKRLEVRKAFLDLRELERRKSERNAQKAQLLQTLNQAENQRNELSRKEGEGKRGLERLLEEESREAVQCFELRSEIRSLTEKFEFNRERLQECRQRKVEIEKEQEILTANLEVLEKEAENNFVEREEAFEERSRAETACEREKELFEKADSEWQTQKEKLERFKGLLFEKAARETRLRNEIHRHRALLESTGREGGRRKESVEKLEKEKARYQEKQIVHREERTKIHSTYQGLQAEQERVASELYSLKTDLEALNREVVEQRGGLQERLSRLKLLEELGETTEGAERKLLAAVASNRLRGKLIRSLSEILAIQPGYESAVEAVLGSFAQGVIAEDVETAQGLLHEMTEAHLGPCGIFIQSLVETNGKHVRKRAVAPPQIHRSIQEVVTVREGFEALFEPLFENVFVVEDFSPEKLGELLPIARQVKLVTRQGILLGLEARIFFRNGRLTPNQGPFERQAEIEELKKTSARLRIALDRTEQDRLNREKGLQALEEKHGALEKETRDLLIRKEATESLLRGLQERISAIEEERRVLGLEDSQSEEEAKGESQRLKECENLLAAVQEEQKSIFQQEKTAHDEVELIQKNREERIRVSARLRTLLENRESELRTFETSNSLLRNQIVNVKERMTRLNQEGETLEKKIREILSEEGLLAARREGVEKERNEAEAKLSEIRGRRAFQEEGLRGVSLELAQEENRQREFRDLLHQEELGERDLGYQERSIHERLEQAYGVKLRDLRSEEFLTEGTDRVPLEEAIQSLREKVESFGPVNLLAIQEYDELKQRYESLASQEKDLREAREALLEAIRKINRTTKTLFSDTFAKAQAFFQEYYGILFGGGHAELLLVEDDLSEEPGIDIFVRPPGKKPQHISLLSGGEKALTAMALLFALFRIKPSPLCVLDEVDAPLDEANVDRFVAVLKAPNKIETFLNSTQFLLITHNRKTIAMADSLYGVTMEESGVSKMVSVKIASSQERPAPEKEESGVAAHPL